MKKKTKAEIEVEISNAIVSFEKEYMGRGPKETRVFLIQDMILIRLRGVLTPAERQLAASSLDGHSNGRTLIKQMRQELLEKARMLLDKIIYDITGQKVVSLHTDISTTTGERIVIFTLENVPSILENIKK